jgi:Plant mobile domain
VRRPVIELDDRCGPTLKKLGLYQLSQIKHTKTDHKLVIALVERWRPETNTFYLPVGEITVTLQDMSCLWELPISDPSVVGPSDRGTIKLIKDVFGMDMNNSMMNKNIQKKGGENEEDYAAQSSLCISLKWLRLIFSKLEENATDEEVARYTQAFVLDMFAFMIFSDTSGDSVPAMYLKFLQNLTNPLVYNWGAAVLSCLYRNLFISCQSGKKTIVGPLLLLQHWAWTRFPIARPRHVDTIPLLGGEDP